MLKLGIIGWGYWGRNYAKYFDLGIDATLEWVCDLREDMLKDAKKRHPHFSVTKNYKDLISNVDGVIIATTASTHFFIAKYFMRNNIPVLIEKPLTNSIISAIKLFELSKKHKAKVLVGHTFLYNESVKWIKKKIDCKYFGKIYHIEFKRQSYGPIRDDVNIVWDFAPHDITIASWFLGKSKPSRIFAIAKKYSRNPQEDIAMISLEYPRNILVEINVAWLYPIKIRSCVILGSKRMAIYEDTNRIEPVRVYNTTVNYPSEDEPYGAAFRLGDIIIPHMDQVDPLYNQLKHFVQYIKGGVQPRTDIKEGVETTILLQALNDSIHKRKEIDFKKYRARYL